MNSNKYVVRISLAEFFASTVTPNEKKNIPMYKYVNQRLGNMFTRIFIYILYRKPWFDVDDGNFRV
jgi:hypothetical protein